MRNASKCRVITTFIVGATGYTGRHLVRQSAARGDKCIAHLRLGSSSAKELREICDEAEAQVEETSFEADAFDAVLGTLSPTFVFACLGTTRRRAATESGARYETVDYGLTKLVIDACVRADRPPHFVYLSAIGAEKAKSNAYMLVRRRIEEDLAAAPISSTIIRPAFITGADRGESRPLERAGAVLGDGVLSVLGALGGGRLKRQYASLNGEDLAAAMLRLSLADESAGKSGVHEGAALRRR